MRGPRGPARGSDRVIFNFHVPPHDTPIDQAAPLDAEFRPIMKGGMPVICGAAAPRCGTRWSGASRC